MNNETTAPAASKPASSTAETVAGNGTDQLGRFQRILADHYENGEFAHITTPDEARDVGDSLFAFLMSELAEDQDCEDLETAIKRVGSAIQQLQEVASALMDAAE